MNKQCGTCEKPLAKVWINSGAGTIMLEGSKKGGPFARKNTSGVDAYVCPTCGRIEWFAKNSSVFDENE